MLNSRIRNKEQEVGVEQATPTPVQEIKFLGKRTWTNPNGSEQSQYEYEILGQVITSNMEISEYELKNMLNVIKNLI